jgi:internalin A
MGKPKEILELEKIYGIELKEVAKKDFSWQTRNSYMININGEITHLNLRKNEIIEIKGLETLGKLQELWLSNNQIIEMKGLEALEKLQKLWLSNNQISEMKGLESLEKLQKLWLFGNQIIEIKGLESLEKLQKLDLAENQIIEIKKLETIIKREKFKELLIDDNPFLNDISLSLKAYENHRDALLKYFSDLKQRKINIKLPAKVMLLGNHGTGKSTFSHYFREDENEFKSTHILRIDSYMPEDAGNGIMLSKALFYDFGGQDYYHGLYQAFLSEESINLLFWCNETNKNDIRPAQDDTNNFTRDFTRKYWLYQLNYAFRKRKEENNDESTSQEPVLLIQTHADSSDSHHDFMGSSVFKIEREFYVSLEKDAVEKDADLKSDLERLKAKLNNLIDEKRKNPVEKTIIMTLFCVIF